MFGVVVLVFLAVFGGSEAFSLFGFSSSIGNCLNTTPIKSLNINSLAGTWYELYSYGMPFTHTMERCLSATITPTSDGKGFSMINDRIIKVLNQHLRLNWDVEGNGNSGDLNLKMKVPFMGSINSPFKILGTDDYKNFFIFHTCLSIGSFFKTNMAFVFTRKRHYEPKELENMESAIREILEVNGLDRNKFTVSNQADCGADPAPPAAGAPAPAPAAGAQAAASAAAATPP